MGPYSLAARCCALVRRRFSAFSLTLSLTLALAVSGCGGGEQAASPADAGSGNVVRALAARDQEAAATPPNESAYSEGGKLLRADPTIAALGPDLFGDKINLYNGALEFVQNDFSIPGHDKLPIGVGRRLVTGTAQPTTAAFADWDLEIPRIQGVFAKTGGWSVPGDRANQLNRCSRYLPPPDMPAQGSKSVFTAPEYWHGNTLYVPGVGAQEIINRQSATPFPNDGNAYLLTTKNYWALRCIPLVRGGGEGFLAVSPDGTRYYFDWMVDRPYAPITRGDPLPPAKGTAPDPSNAATDSVDPPRPAGFLMYRSEVWIMPSKVVDRYGNTVTYNYDPVTPWRVTSIVGDDPSGIPRKLTFHYDLSSTSPLVTRADDGTRTWRYQYTDGPYGPRLTSVTRPDSSTWTFGLENLLNTEPITQGSGGCEGAAALTSAAKTGEITHPSGAKAVFVLKATHHGRSGVPKDCRDVEDAGGWSRYPLYMDTWSVASKVLSGPGINPMAWSYVYGPANASFDDCTTCPTTKTVQVTDARNFVIQHTFGNRFRVNEGQLLKLEEGYAAAGSLRTTAYQYKLSPGNYADPVGYSQQLRTSGDLAYRPAPQESKVIEQQGRTFSWTVGVFDGFARPTLVTRSSGPQSVRTESTVYYDNPRLWVLGQLQSLTEVSTGGVVEAHDYYNESANRKTTYNFTRKVASFEYFADGTLKSKADPIDRKTLYSRYKRGLARTVNYPDGNSESAEVDDLGQIRSVTNAALTTTAYDYDRIGRLKTISPPNEANLSYNPTRQSFEQRLVPEYGLPAGHWVQTVATGNAVTERYFDALWRPVLSRTFDAADEQRTRRVVLRRFDADNRTTFESYALRDLQTVDAIATTGVKGTEWRHDALGRVTQVLQDAENESKLVTTTNYVSDFGKQVINPRSKSTTTYYQTFDTPSEDSISNVIAPESVYVSIVRDVFGKPRSISRANYPGFPIVTRSYVYDVNQRLCKTIEPETGATVQSYDAAGNVQWRASGLNLPGTNDCDQARVSDARKVNFTYDARGRLLNTLYTDSPAGYPGLYDVTRTYTPDGLLETLSTEYANWTYSYNRRRVLTNEDMSLAGSTYRIEWGINANGHVKSVTLPARGAPVQNFTPNALGEPTEASGYASNATYHPNGALAGYTLANGVVHTMTQNVRGLPELWADSGVVRDRYTYDENGNVQSIADEQEGQPTRGMTYDGLDRLTNASGIWGSATYVYDAVDNMRSSTVGPRAYTHVIDGVSNRLKALNSLNGNFPSMALDYDANGNLKQRGSQTFVFDMGNRLRFATGKAAYGYDGHGRRWWTGYYSPNAPAAITSYNLSAYSQGGKLMYEWHNQKGSFWPIYLGNRLIAEVRSTDAGVTSTAFVHTDALGSPVARTSASATTGSPTVTRTRYEPYGGPTPNGAPQPTGIGFTGHVNDADTGLVYMQQRYYDPVAGRFLSIDPVTTDANTGRAFGRYHYAENNPYAYTDPTGKESELAEGVVKMRATSDAHSFGQSTTTVGGSTGTGSSSLGSVSRISGSSTGSANAVGGFLPGTQMGESAAQHWADLQVSTGNPMYAVPGMLAALWTPETATSTAITLATGGFGAIKAIPQGIAIGWKSTAGVWAHTYKHGGGGINLFIGGSRVLAVDYHAFKLNGVTASRLHYHRGLAAATQKLHRPYQGGP